MRVTALPDAEVAVETPTVEFAIETAPGVTVTVGAVVVIAEPFIEAVMPVAVPDETPVNVAL